MARRVKADPTFHTGVSVVIECFGDIQISRDLLRFGERAIRATPLWNAIYRDLLLIEKVQFLTEGEHGSGGWPELAQSTLNAKVSRRQQPWILRASQSLFRSLTRSGAPGNIREVAPTWMRFGSDIPYGIHHQTGTSHMPQRKPIELTETERRMIVKSVQLYILRGAPPSEFGVGV
jgi:hypothetical protein